MLDTTLSTSYLQILFACVGTGFTLRATATAYRDVVESAKQYPQLQIVAVRRLRHQVLLLLAQVILFMAGSANFMLSGEAQAAVCSIAMATTTCVLVVMSIADRVERLLFPVTPSREL